MTNEWTNGDAERYLGDDENPAPPAACDECRHGSLQGAHAEYAPELSEGQARCLDCGKIVADPTVPDPDLECLDGPEGGCEGRVEYRMALSATGTSFPRCDKHWVERLDEQERINRQYPDSPSAPEWFDPAYAGERWDDE